MAAKSASISALIAASRNTQDLDPRYWIGCCVSWRCASRSGAREKTSWGAPSHRSVPQSTELDPLDSAPSPPLIFKNGTTHKAPLCRNADACASCLFSTRREGGRASIAGPAPQFGGRRDLPSKGRNEAELLASRALCARYQGAPRSNMRTWLDGYSKRRIRQKPSGRSRV
jgi:hypothetical protein